MTQIYGLKNLLIPRIMQKIPDIQINVANLIKKTKYRIRRFDYILFLVILESG